MTNSSYDRITMGNADVGEMTFLSPVALLDKPQTKSLLDLPVVPAGEGPNSPLILEARTAAAAIDSVLQPERYNKLFDGHGGFFEDENNPKPIDQNVFRSQEENMVKLLRGFDHAKKQFEYYYWNDFNNYQKDDWDDLTEGFGSTLTRFLQYGVPKGKLNADIPLSQADLDVANSQGMGVIREWLKSDTFEAHEELTGFLSFSLWYDWKGMVETSVLPERNFGALFATQDARFEKTRGMISPLLHEAGLIAARTSNKTELRTIFEGFQNTGLIEDAKQLLLDPYLTQEQRQTTLVEYINTYGFIDAVDLLGAKAKDASLLPELQAQIKYLYSAIEGDEARQIMADLSQVYANVDFSQYTINNQELTRDETAIIDEAAVRVMEHKGSQDKATLHVMDIGAGTGRHALAMRSRGYTNITALEYEQKHVDQIAKVDPKLRAIQGSWYDLKKIREEHNLQPADVEYCLGRTYCHNRKSHQMLQFFDNVMVNLADEGEAIVDSPDIDWGVYQERVTRLSENLDRLGVDPRQSRFIFDGPSDKHRFNRLVLRPDQVQAMADLLGLKITATDHRIIGEAGEIKNIYYHFTIDQDWRPGHIGREELWDKVRLLGLLEPGTNLDTYVNAWDMTLGQALLFGLDDEGIRRMNESGHGPKVWGQLVGRELRLNSSYPA